MGMEEFENEINASFEKFGDGENMDTVLVWENLEKMMEEKQKLQVEVAGIVNAGVICYVEGIRGFLPASQIAMNYVENTEDYLGKKLEVVIIDVDSDNEKLVLSAKEVLKEKARQAKEECIAGIQPGQIVQGVVESLMPYGAFIRFTIQEESLSGLVHISQICNRHLKSPKEELKIGQEVKAKVLDVKEGKISLSIKALEEQEELAAQKEQPVEYISGEEASTSLASLLKGLNLS